MEWWRLEYWVDLGFGEFAANPKYAKKRAVLLGRITFARICALEQTILFTTKEIKDGPAGFG